MEAHPSNICEHACRLADVVCAHRAPGDLRWLPAHCVVATRPPDLGVLPDCLTHLDWKVAIFMPLTTSLSPSAEMVPSKRPCVLSYFIMYAMSAAACEMSKSWLWPSFSSRVQRTVRVDEGVVDGDHLEVVSEHGRPCNEPPYPAEACSDERVRHAHEADAAAGCKRTVDADLDLALCVPEEVSEPWAVQAR